MTRALWIAASLIAAASVPMTTSAAAGTPNPIVRTTYGKVQGIPGQGVTAFLGLHYGADTGGAHRFLPARAPTAWSGVRAADKMGDRCPQPVLPKGLLSFSDAPTSEDCLALNIWTPQADHGRRPVMVWLHGGGYSFGSANDKYYDGAGLARRGDVVVISINHRLNAFGYLALGPEAGPAYAGSGLVGQTDIIQALTWIKANAARFGGDPNNVTVFGQSGGGGKVVTLLAMPGAHGLFQKAIVESGPTPRVDTDAEAIAVRDKVLAALNLKPADAGKLRDVPAADLVAAAQKAGLLAFGPHVDGRLLPGQPFDPIATAISADVPLMIGTAKDEATSLLLANPNWPKMTEADLAKAAASLAGPQRATVAVALYQSVAPDDKPMHIFASLMTDQGFTAKSLQIAERKAAQRRAPVFVYRTDWRTPVLNGVLRAPHAIEIPFVFDTVAVSPELVGSGPSQSTMTDLFTRTFTAFARTGNPSVKGYPIWPAYTAEQRMTFIYDDPPKVVADPDSAKRRFWDSAGR